MESAKEKFQGKVWTGPKTHRSGRFPSNLRASWAPRIMKSGGLFEGPITVYRHGSSSRPVDRIRRKYVDEVEDQPHRPTPIRDCPNPAKHEQQGMEIGVESSVLDFLPRRSSYELISSDLHTTLHTAEYSRYVLWSMKTYGARKNTQ